MPFSMRDEKGINIDARLRSLMPSGTPVYSVQCTVYSVQCALYTILCTVYSVHYYSVPD